MWSGRTERPYGGSLSERLHALRHGDTTWPRVKEWIDPPPPPRLGGQAGVSHGELILFPKLTT